MDDLEQITIRLYKELKAKADERAKDEKEASNYNNSLIFRGEKQALNYVVRKLKNNFEWLSIDF